MNDETAHRKRTGSYYTPVELVNLALDEALDPLITRAGKEADPESALLQLTVCDPACGGGVFLVLAARRLAAALAGHRAGRSQPRADHLRLATRDVVTRCIYGVDLNPLAVDLTRLCLAIEALQPGRPNPDLSHHVKCGNALLGATPALLAQGLPDAAFTPLPGDDPKAAEHMRRRNKRERDQAPAETRPGRPGRRAPDTGDSDGNRG